METTISILVPSSNESEEIVSSNRSHSPLGPYRTLEFDPKRIVDQLTSLVNAFDSFSPNIKSDYCLSEMELNFALNGNGKLTFLGIGVNAGIQTSIKVKITKSK